MARKKMSFQKGSVELKNGQWTLRYRLHGKIKREVLGKFKDKTAARNAAMPIMIKVNEQNNNSKKLPVLAHSDVTFREFLDEHWKSYSAKHKRSTKDCWGSLIKTHLLPYFGDKMLSEITPTDVQRFMDGLRGFSANSLHSVYNLTKLLFEIASQYDLIVKSPVRSMMHRPATVEKAHKPTLTFDHIKAILEALPENESLLITILAVTGIRSNECFALRWKDFNSASSALQIDHGIYRKELQSPKSKSSQRTILVPSVIVVMLASHKERSAFKSDTDFIFCMPDGSPYHAATARKRLYRAMDAVGIQRVPRMFGLHIFRRTAGTLVNDRFHDLKLFQGTLGHSTIAVTSDVYVQQSESKIAKATEFLTKGICAPGHQQQAS